MFESADIGVILRNLSIYTVGVALAVVGALGIVEAIALSPWLAALCFAGGLAVVIGVHEYLGGPV